MKSKQQRPAVKIGLCGFGVVGQGVWKHIHTKSRELEQRLGVRLELVRAAVRDVSKPRGISIEKNLLTNDPLAVATDPEVQIVCELMGGTGLAREVTLTALRAGKVVVTANKALLCDHGAEIFEAARSGGGHIFFEASVAGGIPIIKALREGLVANRFRLIYGILNGTCNYILTRMEREGLPYETVLKEAKKLGYAEAEESLDVDGWDTAHKASILAFLAHGRWVKPQEMFLEGIRRISPSDIAYAKTFDYSIKLLAVIQRNFDTNDLFVCVQPTLVPKRKVLANVNEVYNGICVSGDVVGTTVYIGRGAGQDATSSAVISDIADAVTLLSGKKASLLPDEAPSILDSTASSLKLTPLKNVVSRYYIRLTVKDAPGVLAQVATVLANNHVSIASVLQREDGREGIASLILTTHSTNEQAIQQTLLNLKSTPSVMDEPVLLRIGDFDD